MLDFAEALRSSLSQRPIQTRAEWEARPAAVLIPLYQDRGEWHVLLTERTDMVEDHKGQVSFPGGRVDDGDASRVETALRETEEEIGVRRAEVRVLGQIDELLTVTQYRVTPIVGVIPWPHDFRISGDELSEVFGVPLRWLADPSNLEIKLFDHPILGSQVPVFFFHFGVHTIWGVTARIIVNFLEVARPLLFSLAADAAVEPGQQVF